MTQCERHLFVWYSVTVLESVRRRKTFDQFRHQQLKTLVIEMASHPLFYMSTPDNGSDPPAQFNTTPSPHPMMFDMSAPENDSGPPAQFNTTTSPRPMMLHMSTPDNRSFPTQVRTPLPHPKSHHHQPTPPLRAPRRLADSYSDPEEAPVTFEVQDPIELTDTLDNSSEVGRRNHKTVDDTMRSLEANCRRNGYKFTRKTVMDGNCFFRAISEQMARCGCIPQDPNELRINLVTNMERYPRIKAPDGDIDLRMKVNGSWSRYLADMKGNNTHADAVAVVAMAHYLQKDIMIITSFKFSTGLVDDFMLVRGPLSSFEPPLAVGHLLHVYYQCLEPIIYEKPGSDGSGFMKQCVKDLEEADRLKKPKSRSPSPSPKKKSPILSRTHFGRTREKSPDRGLQFKFEESGSHSPLPDWMLTQPGGEDYANVDIVEDIDFNPEISSSAQLQNLNDAIEMTREHSLEVYRNIRREKNPYKLEAYHADHEHLIEKIRDLEKRKAAMQRALDAREITQEARKLRQIDQLVEQCKRILGQRPIDYVCQPLSPEADLLKYANETRLDPRSMSQQVQWQWSSNSSKDDWIASHIVNFLSQFELLRHMVGQKCNDMDCGIVMCNHIASQLRVASSMLTNPNIFPILKIQPYPETFMRDASAMCTCLCEVYVHFRKCHGYILFRSRHDVAQIGLHFYAFVKTFNLLDYQHLKQLEDSLKL